MNENATAIEWAKVDANTWRANLGESVLTVRRSLSRWQRQRAPPRRSR
jgi:hypothetical protein